MMWKKVLVLVLLVLFVTACVSFNEVSSNEEKEANFTIIGKESVELEHGKSSAVIVEDQTTGCQYIILSPGANSRAMSPYYDSGGEVKGCKNN